MGGMMYNKSIFIFRRDFRLEDNIGLIKALKNSETVIPIFIFTNEQIIRNKYKSNNAIQFMFESLTDLDCQLQEYGSKLLYCFGSQEVVIQDLVVNNNIDAVYINSDYTPYSKDRDEKIKKVCAKNNAYFESNQDTLLHDIGGVLTSTGKPYLKYTPFFNKAVKIKVDAPKINKNKNYIQKNTKIISEFILPIASIEQVKQESLQNFLIKDFVKNNNIALKGGRQEALKILNNIKNFKDYDKNRNFLYYETTKLSAYIKFGCISIREVFAVFIQTGSKDLIRQLYWRDFYYQLLNAYPKLLGHAMKEKYDKIIWPENKLLFQKWQDGQTGFPAIDACMRELNQTGFMHNRGRLIVSNFLVKILLIDWRFGEKYFANKLVDYDVAVNNGNWQWSAGTGADSQPYFRIFNTWTQSKKFDANCEYIKKWLPELKNVKPADIHKWDKKHKEYANIEYPAPIIDYSQARKSALELYNKYLKY